MANNTSFTVYQIGQKVSPRDQAQRIGFPSTGVMVYDVTTSQTRSLSSGYNVYGAIAVNFITASGVNQQPLLYYVQETVAQIQTALG